MRWRAAALPGAALLLAGAGAQAADLRVCVDTASAASARDAAMAARVAGQAGLRLVVAPFDGSGGDDGFPLKRFREMLTSRCDLVMGFPIDTAGGEPPAGLLATKPYAQTGFVLVDAPGTTARRLGDLPAGTRVAVTGESPPALYFTEGGKLVPEVHETDAETLQAVATGKVAAAMVWQPTLAQYEGRPGAVALTSTPLDEPHARYDVVALYLSQGAPQAQMFNATKIALTDSAPALPALYTKAQAVAGFGAYLGNCAMCHGSHLEGRSAPSLVGPNWANAKADYTLGEVFTVVSQQMPATDPGSLQHDEYVDIMAYLLQQNGYPAGDVALGFDGAAGSVVPLRWHGN